MILLSAILLFQTVSADVPILSNEIPANTSTDISTSISLINVTISNADGDTFNWTIETNPNVGGSSDDNASNGSKTCSVSGLSFSTTYRWYVNVTDGTNWTRKIYCFTTAVEETSDIEIYPANPKAGGSLAVILKGKYEGENADGLLYCNNNLYSFSISNGVGVITLNQYDYGSATIRIFSKDFFPFPTEITKTITIAQPSTDNVRLLTSSTAVVNKETSVVLRFNREPLPDFEVKLKSPEGKESYDITDENGKIYVTLDKAGIWSFDANVYGTTITAMTSVIYEPVMLSIAGTPSVGVETVITTEPYASVEIFLEGEVINQYVASPQGIIEFTPNVGGFYEVLSRTDSKKGTYVFEVADTATIRILDALTTLPATSFEKGKVYQIIISNNAGITLDAVETLYITTPFATTEILSLDGGKATWMPHLTGSYIFTVEGTETCAEALQYIVVEESLVEGTNVAIPIISTIVLIILIIAISIVYYARHNKIPLKNIFKNLKFAGKKTSLPFD
jgi:hypothetical protein